MSISIKERLIKAGYSEKVADKLVKRMAVKVEPPVEVKPEVVTEPEGVVAPVAEPPSLRSRPFFMDTTTRLVHRRSRTDAECGFSAIPEQQREYLTLTAARNLIAAGDATPCPHCYE